MASIKVKYRPSTVRDHDGAIFFRIVHNRKARQLSSGYHIKSEEWNANQSMVIARHNSERKTYILTIKQRIRQDVERLTQIVRKFDADGMEYSVDDVANEFKRYYHDYTLTNYIQNLIYTLKKNGKIRTAETYAATLKSFTSFLREEKERGRMDFDEPLLLDSITAEIMEAYEAWHIKRGNTPNTISFYIRILRAVYNRAVDENAIVNRNPFRHVYTGVEKTVKRAVPLDVIRKIKKMDLSMSPSLDYARDMFLMSFFLRGMSFIDMAYLRKSDYRNGYIIYRRRKTGQQLTIEWTKEMQTILDKYPVNPTQYLLPIIRTEGINERSAYRNVGYNINHSLRRVAERAGINVPLTMYVARHSWASAAKTKGIPLSIISEGMGHDSERTTLIYLASLESSVVDKANMLIMNELF